MSSIRRRVVALGILLGALLLTLAAQGQELSFNYDVTPHKFKVCVLLVPASGDGSVLGYDNPNAYLFPALLKSPYWPAGWELENPLAPSCVTQQISSLWTDALGAPYASPHFTNALNPVFGSHSNYWTDRGWASSAAAIGTPLVKDLPAYWEVDISRINPDQLAQFDLIYVSSGATITGLSAVQLQGLLKAVEGGTTLWVDNARPVEGATLDVGLMPPRVVTSSAGIPRELDLTDPAFSFFSGTAAVLTRTRATQANTLLQEPFTLSAAEVAQVGDWPNPNALVLPVQLLPSDDNVTSSAPSLDLIPQPVIVGSNGNLVVLAGRYGSGALVITAGNVGRDCWEWMLAGWRQPYIPEESADLKLATNIFAYGTEWSQPRQGPTGRASSPALSMGPLDIGWQFPGPNGEVAPLTAATPIGPSVGTPVVANGMVYVLTTSGPNGAAPYLFCFDAKPERDLDGDDNPDDGLGDYTNGTPYDMIWYANLSSYGTPRASSPTVVDVNVTETGGAIHQVPVVLVSCVTSDGHGSVRAFNGLVDITARTALGGNFLVPGTPLGTYTVPSYGSSSQMVDLSSPVAYKDWVCVLASEIDTTLGSAANDCTYGRVFCFGLGDVLPSPYSGPSGVWAYPDADQNEQQRSLPPFVEPAWLADTSRAELPPNPPALPVISTDMKRADGAPVELAIICQTPVSHIWDTVHTSITTDLNDPTFLLSWDNINRGTFNRAGGSQFCLVPTPYDGSAYPLNDAYYEVRLTNADPAISGAVRTSTSSEPTPTPVGPPLAVGTTQFVWFNDIASGAAPVRQFLSTLTGAAGTQDANPLNLQLGCDVSITYTSGGVSYTDTVRLPGPVLWRKQLADNQRLVGAPATHEGLVVSSSDLPDYDSPTSTWQLPTGLTPPASSQFYLRGAADGAQEYAWDPRVAAPYLYHSGTEYAVDDANDPPVVLQVATSQSSPALMGDTAIAAYSRHLYSSGAEPSEPDSGIYALRTTPDPSIHLVEERTGYSPLPDSVGIDRGSPLTITTVESGGATTVLPEDYEVDYESRIVRLKPIVHLRTSLDNVVESSVDGKAVLVTWTDTQATPATHTDELHVVPPTLRWAYIPGMIKLNYYPVVLSTISVTLPDGTPVPYSSVLGAPGWHAGEATTTLSGQTVLPNGWIDLANAWPDINNNGLRDLPSEQVSLSGRDVVVRYTGWSEAAAVYTPVPNQLLGIPAERHQVPIGRPLPPPSAVVRNENGFGTSHSGIAVGHNTAIIGTEGAWDPTTLQYISPDGLSVADANLQRPPDATLLSLLWDPVRHYVRGFLDPVTAPLGTTAGGAPRVAVPTGAAALSDDGVFVGSHERTLGGPEQTAAAERGGFVSALRPARTLICDNTRLVETVGDWQTWVCTGSRAPYFGESSPEGSVTRAFSRPAKATVLPPASATVLDYLNGVYAGTWSTQAARSDTILVVDTGNDRVIEIDRDGNQLWPLDENGNDYYTSPLNQNLQLSQPADAYRYTWLNPVTGFVETHTVIADAGNYRLVDVVTEYRRETSTTNPDRPYQFQYQIHQVRVLTPSHARLTAGAQPQRVKYVKAQPIWNSEPGGTRRVIGYLCAAAGVPQALIVEAGTKLLDPPAFYPDGSERILPGTGMSWKSWTWLYRNAGTDGVFGTADDVYDPLTFGNIRQLEYFWQGSAIHVCVVGSQYRGRQSALTSPTSAVINEEGVFEWTIDINYATGAQGLNLGSGPDGMSFVFTGSHYNYLPGPDESYGLLPNTTSLYAGRYRTGDETPRPLATVYTPNGAAYPKAFYPVCAQRLQNGNYLITNYTGIAENLTQANLGEIDPVTHSMIWANTSSGASLYSEVFEAVPGQWVEVPASSGNWQQPVPGRNPTIDPFRVIPDPWDVGWSEPLNQPTYAERF